MTHGLPAIAARNSAKLIGELNWGLVGDMFVIFIFLGIALRSVLPGVASVKRSLSTQSGWYHARW